MKLRVKHTVGCDESKRRISFDGSCKALATLLPSILRLLLHVNTLATQSTAFCQFFYLPFISPRGVKSKARFLFWSHICALPRSFLAHPNVESMRRLFSNVWQPAKYDLRPEFAILFTNFPLGRAKKTPIKSQFSFTKEEKTSRKEIVVSFFLSLKPNANSRKIIATNSRLFFISLGRNLIDCSIKTISFELFQSGEIKF